MKPNLKNLYRNGFKWCGFCGESRLSNEKNRCTTCSRLLRGNKK